MIRMATHARSLTLAGVSLTAFAMANPSTQLLQVFILAGQSNMEGLRSSRPGSSRILQWR
ncbi:TPA: hypothetical protein EYN98_31235 [Candidatus Poribacteria bacterium]|nr:hypothetical protein [Candidatus Poribacteria bacterium]HIB86087.1 hypothetical protein [Candidatus Poribacteria bacterium]HIC00644.1 hypothetical protein [Candidatus Poribacteria bacterium]HIC18033.1 hypothetical protein [Candidatus Poribacteria bacterium]HIO05396.1 hypothetical protein [Candidatus Poribacteria bacterium]